MLPIPQAIKDQIIQAVTETAWNRPELARFREPIVETLKGEQFSSLMDTAFERYRAGLSDEERKTLPDLFDEGLFRVVEARQMMGAYIEFGTALDLERLNQIYAERNLRPKDAPIVTHHLQALMEALSEAMANHESYRWLLFWREIRSQRETLERLEALFTEPEDDATPPSDFPDVPLILSDAQNRRGVSKSRLFISYKRGTDGVGRLIDELKANRYAVWFDRYDILPGDANWREKIKAGIWECAGVILCLTPEASRSKPIQFEIHTAIQMKKPIFPIVMEKLDQIGNALIRVGLPDAHVEENFYLSDQWEENFNKLRLGLEEKGIIVTSQERRKDRTSEEYTLHQRYLAKLVAQENIGRLSLANINPDATGLEGAPLEEVFVTLPTAYHIAVEVQDYIVVDWWINDGRHKVDGFRFGADKPEDHPPESRTRPEALNWQDVAVFESLIDQLQDELDKQKQEANEAQLTGEDFWSDEEDGVYPDRIALTVHDIVAACPRMVVLGAPGSGKSTFVRHLALCMAGEARDNWTRQATLANLGRWTHRALTPIYIELRLLVSSRHFPQNMDTMPTVDDLWSYIETELLEDDLQAYSKHLKEDLETGHALLILDGLDEVPYPAGADNLKKRQEQLKALCNAIDDNYGKTRVIIASRPYAYEGWTLPDFEAVEITSFNAHRRQELVSNIYKVSGLTDEASQEKAKRLESALGRIHNDLKDRPLFITMMATVFNSGEEGLPTRTGALYRENILLLLERWTTARKTGKSLPELLGSISEIDLLDRLSALAYDVHMQGSANDAEQASLIPFDLLSKHFFSLEWKQPDFDARAVIAYLSENAGILVSPGDKTGAPDFYFAHRTFQEYLAARHIANLCDQNYAVLRQLIGEKAQLWRIPALFVGDVIRDSEDERDSINRLFELIEDVVGMEDDPPDTLLADDLPTAWCIWLAGQIAIKQDLHRQDLKRGKRRILEDLAQWQQALITRQGLLAPPERRDSGQVLSLLDGDRRSGIGINADGLPDIEWVKIPAGEFVYQEEEAPRYLPDFELSAYPVTMLQFQAFIDAPDGYRNKDIDWFAGLAANESNKQIGEPRFPYSNHPRDSVSWYYAMAYCRWLSYKLGGGYDLKAVDKWAVRLPTEMEWEKAARYPDGRQYVWGDEYKTGMANIVETWNDVGTYYLGITSAVGLYPSSPLGLYDLNGNIREWCLSDYGSPAEHSHEEDLTTSATRVLRGGSWLNDDDDARSASRDYYGPNLDYNSFGFRLFRPPSL